MSSIRASNWSIEISISSVGSADRVDVFSVNLDASSVMAVNSSVDDLTECKISEIGSRFSTNQLVSGVGIDTTVSGGGFGESGFSDSVMIEPLSFPFSFFPAGVPVLYVHRT